MTLPLATEVQVKSVPRWLRPFAGKGRRQDAGKKGFVAFAEIGKNSKKPLYTIVFHDGSTGCYFENELLFNSRPPRTTQSGETVH